MGTVLALVVVVLDQAGVRNPFVLWTAFAFAFALLIDATALRSQQSVSARAVWAAAVIGIACASAWYLNGKINRPDFMASLGGTLEKPAAGGEWGAWAAAVGVPDNRILVSVDYMPTLRITNLQNVSSSIKSYSLEVRTNDGKWAKLLRVPIPSDSKPPTDPSPALYFILSDNGGTLVSMTPHESLDDVLRNRPIAPGESASGWTYWAFPDDFAGMKKPIVARISIEDWAGHKSKSIYRPQDGRESVLENNNSVTLGKEPLDMSKFMFRRYTDFPNLCCLN